MRSSVIGCVAKGELTKKGVMEDFSEIQVFFKKRVKYNVIYQISDSRERQKRDKIQSMTKKVIRNLWR